MWEKEEEKMKKRMIILCVICLIISLPVQAAGVKKKEEVKPEIQLYYVYAKTVTLGINYSGSYVKPTVTVRAKNSTRKIKGTLKLYKKKGSSYDFVKQWDATSNSNTLNITKSYKGAKKGNIYKVKFTGKIFSTEKNESITQTCTRKYE